MTGRVHLQLPARAAARAPILAPMKLPRLPAPRLLAPLALAGLAACASRGIDAQWSDPQLAAGTPLRGARVLVVCEAPEEVLARICLDHLKTDLAARGMTALTAPGVPPPAPGQARDDTRYLAAAREATASAVWVAGVGPDAFAGERAGSSGVSIGLGGFGFGRNSAVGLGVSVPIAGTAPATPLAADVRVSNATSGRLMWTARAGAASSGDARGQVDELLQRLMSAADQSLLY